MQSDRIDFFVAGAPKSGTSSLYEILSTHSQIITSKLKETHYFSRDEAVNSYYKVDVVESEKQLCALYPSVQKNNGFPLLGDFSPSYLASDSALNKIKEYNNNAKLIFILRDPVRRAISHYFMDVSLGYSSAGTSIEDYIESSDRHRYQYLQCGQYKSGLSIAKSLFKDNVLVVGYEDFVENPESVVLNITDFLGVAHDMDINFNVHSNPGVIDTFGLYGFYNRSGAMKRLGRFFPKTLKQSIKELTTKRGRPSAVVDAQSLAKYFSDDVRYMKSYHPEVAAKWENFYFD